MLTHHRQTGEGETYRGTVKPCRQVSAKRFWDRSVLADFDEAHRSIAASDHYPQVHADVRHGDSIVMQITISDDKRLQRNRLVLGLHAPQFATSVPGAGDETALAVRITQAHARDRLCVPFEDLDGNRAIVSGHGVEHANVAVAQPAPGEEEHLLWLIETYGVRACETIGIQPGQSPAGPNETGGKANPPKTKDRYEISRKVKIGFEILLGKKDSKMV